MKRAQEYSLVARLALQSLGMEPETWLRRGIAVVGGAVGGLGLGALASEFLQWRTSIIATEYILKFQGSGVNSPDLVPAGLALGIGVGLVVAALIRDRARQ